MIGTRGGVRGAVILGAAVACVGCAGATGPQGSEGSSGPTGASGLMGETGSTGAKGAIGPSGTPGAQGANGTDGVPGVSGATGPTGPAGVLETVDGGTLSEDAGVILVAGTMGPTGLPGSTGSTGPTGATGIFSGTFAGNAIFTGNATVQGALAAAEASLGDGGHIATASDDGNICVTKQAPAGTPADELYSDLFHTNGLGCGQIMMSGNTLNSNTNLYLNIDDPPFGTAPMFGVGGAGMADGGTAGPGQNGVVVGHDLMVGGHLIATGPAAQTTLNGLYFGVTPTTTTGAISFNGLTGYRAAKSLCEAYAGTLAATTAWAKYAHMCSAEELVRSEEVGALTAPSSPGWYSTFVRPLDIGQGPLDDCNAWTSASSSEWGAAAWPAAQAPRVVNYTNCSSVIGVACCL